MSHGIFRPLLLTLVVMFLVVGSSAVLFAADAPDGALVDDAEMPRVSSSHGDLIAHGTAWVPQQRNRFSRWSPMAWGTEVKAKPAALGQDHWVHIPVPLVNAVVEYTRLKLTYVEFCAKSSNGARTMPVQMDAWSDGGKFYSAPIEWAPDNTRQCVSATFSPGVLEESLGISVLLHFGDAADQITLYRALATVE